MVEAASGKSFMSFCCQMGKPEEAAANVDMDEMDNHADQSFEENDTSDSTSREKVSELEAANAEQKDAVIHRGRNFRALLTRGLQVNQINSKDLAMQQDRILTPKVLWLDAEKGSLLYCTGAKNNVDSIVSGTDGCATDDICIRIDDVMDIRVVDADRVIQILHPTRSLTLELGSVASCASFRDRFMELRDYRSRQTENEKFKTINVEFRRHVRSESFRLTNVSMDEKAAQKGKLGFKIVSKDKKIFDGDEGRWHRVLMTHVTAKSQAANQGVRAGDLILKVNGKEVFTSAETFEVIKESVGESGFVLMTIGRMKDGNMPRESVIMAEEEKKGKSFYSIKLEKGTIGWAIGPSSLTATASCGEGIQIIVKSVTAGSQAAQFGVQIGDQIQSVNSKDVSSLDTLIASIKNGFHDVGTVDIGLITSRGVHIRTQEGILAERFIYHLHSDEEIGWKLGETGTKTDSQDGGVLVTIKSIAPQSQAELAGVSVGDRIVAMNGKLMADVAQIEVALKNDGRSVTITLERKVPVPAMPSVDTNKELPT